MIIAKIGPPRRIKTPVSLWLNLIKRAGSSHRVPLHSTISIMSYYPQQPTYNYQVPYNSPYQSPYTYPSSSSHNQMPTYYVDSRRSTSRSHSKHNPPVIFQTPSGHQYYPTARDYAYSDGGRRRRASSVGHGGHYSTSYYPPPSRSARSNSHGRSSRDYGTSSSHHRSHSHSRPVYYESSHHGGGYHDGRRPSVSYVCLS